MHVLGVSKGLGQEARARGWGSVLLWVQQVRQRWLTGEPTVGDSCNFFHGTDQQRCLTHTSSSVCRSPVLGRQSHPERWPEDH